MLCYGAGNSLTDLFSHSPFSDLDENKTTRDMYATYCSQRRGLIDSVQAFESPLNTLSRVGCQRYDGTLHFAHSATLNQTKQAVVS